MQIETLASTISDNYFYLIHDGEVGALVDPIDSDTAIAAVERAGVRLEWLINTHFHPDHVGGNDAVLAHFPDTRLCAGPDHVRISSARPFDLVLGHGDALAFGSLQLDVLEVPGHTAGHIALHSGLDLFSGDTIFVAGCGHCRFGGDPAALFRTFRDVIAGLPDETRFYPGHDYAARNLEFAISLEPNRAPATAKLAEVRAADAPRPALTTLGSERQYNPFFRAGDPALREALLARHADVWNAERAVSADDDEATFRAVRTLRNSW